jgi:hypothetical protein
MFCGRCRAQRPATAEQAQPLQVVGDLPDHAVHRLNLSSDQAGARAGSGKLEE